MAWLRGRGLENHTIARFHLGYLPAEGWTSPVPRPDGTIAGIRHERGILIPWPAPRPPGSASSGPEDRLWCGANVRLSSNLTPLHLGGMLNNATEVYGFLEARFAGLPAISNCWRI